MSFLCNYNYSRILCSYIIYLDSLHNIFKLLFCIFREVQGERLNRFSLHCLYVNDLILFIYAHKFNLLNTHLYVIYMSLKYFFEMLHMYHVLWKLTFFPNFFLFFITKTYKQHILVYFLYRTLLVAQPIFSLCERL